jgi:hypothetical protein
MFGLGHANGFVWQFVAQGLEPIEFLNRPAVMPFGLGLVAEEQGDRAGFFGYAVEAFAQAVVTVLLRGDFEIAGAHSLIHEDQRPVPFVEGLVEASREDAGLQASGAEHGLRGQGDAFDGEEFLGVDGLMDGHGVVPDGRFR